MAIDRQRICFPSAERISSIPQAVNRRLVKPLADVRNLPHVLLALVAGAFRFRDRDVEIALVDHLAAQRRNLAIESGNAERGRSHVDAVPSRAEVERHADDVDGAHDVISSCTTPRSLRPTA
jgi:hypothetical protein